MSFQRQEEADFLREVEEERRVSLTTVCDDCLNVAYDHGVQGYHAQADVMREVGAEVEDHLCGEVETDGDIKCGCGCRNS